MNCFLSYMVQDYLWLSKNEVNIGLNCNDLKILIAYSPRVNQS